MGDTVEFTTEGPLSPEKILNGALRANLKEVVVVGETQQGTVVLYATTGEAKTINWFLDCAKKLTMDACFIEVEE